MTRTNITVPNVTHQASKSDNHNHADSFPVYNININWQDGTWLATWKQQFSYASELLARFATHEFKKKTVTIGPNFENTKD